MEASSVVVDVCMVNSVAALRNPKTRGTGGEKTAEGAKERRDIVLGDLRDLCVFL
jgi:hypothetical protein